MYNNYSLNHVTIRIAVISLLTEKGSDCGLLSEFWLITQNYKVSSVKVDKIVISVI